MPPKLLYYPAVRQGFAAAMVGLVLLLPASAPAWAWGCAGHAVVALLAAAQLRPAALTQVRELLAVTVTRKAAHRCRGTAALPPMARAASWADEVRTPSTEGFHFLDLPLSARRGRADLAALCQYGCLSAALDQFLTQLRAPATPPEQRAVALRYVIHLAGDAFQPLHVSDDDDRGGNCVRTRLPGERHASNLHADWDTRILEGMMGATGPEAYARQLDRRFGRRYAGGSSQPLTWIWTTHAVAVKSAFGPLHLSPGCHSRPLRLSRTYVRQARQAIAVQLDRAGWRLAAVLNQLPPRSE